MILIFGNKGQVASSLKTTRLSERATFLGSDQVCFLNPRGVTEALDAHQPKLVINTSAYTQVDKAEHERENCFRINVEAVKEIALWCARNNASLIHFSTDYVFPGDGEEAWVESAPLSPVNWYGETKRRGEKVIAESGCHAVIIRTSWIFSEFGKNFLKTMLEIARRNDSIKVVEDQDGAPTYAGDLANFVDRIADDVLSKRVSGVYHVCNSGFTSWHGFASEIFRQTPEPLKVRSVIGIPTSDYPTPAKRPRNSRLSCEKVQRDFGVHLPSWQDAVTRCLRNLENGNH